ncbi:MAG: tetratricopeptide repeat protein [Magnetovibrionaceae bacterium]
MAKQPTKAAATPKKAVAAKPAKKATRKAVLKPQAPKAAPKELEANKPEAASKPAPTKATPGKAPSPRAASRAASKPAPRPAPKPKSEASASAPPTAGQQDGAPLDLGPREREAVRLFTLAATHHRAGRLADAVRGYARALALNPRFPDIYNNLGVALRAQGKFDAAVACYRRALTMRPDNAGAYSNMGNALREMGRFGLALQCHEKAVSLRPNWAEGIYNLGLVHRDRAETDKALAAFDRAIKINPDYVDAHWDRSLCLLQKGDFTLGFAEYDWRWKLPSNPPRRFAQPRWNGEPLKGKALLVHQEQGFGDVIQFLRFAPEIKKLGARVIFEVQPELMRLAGTVDGIDAVVVRDGPLPAFDYWLPMLSLPALLGTTIETIPTKIPYVSAPDVHGLRLPERDGFQRVGISWAGKATHQNDRNRSASLSDFLELCGLMGCQFFSLQKGPPAQQLIESGCEALIDDLGPQFEDFADTAAAMMQLDLIITVDTAVAHLAGALGRDVWVVVPYATDWRWLRERTDNPWYPSLRLFRQERHGDWRSVFLEVRKALQERLAAKS